MSLETMTKLQTVTVGAGGTSSIDFTNIPQTYTDLVISLSIKDTSTGTSGASYIDLQFNNSTGTYTVKRLLGAASATASNSAQTSNFMSIGYMGNSRASMANAFTTAELYIPNYTNFNQKTINAVYSMPDSSTGSYNGYGAGLWNQVDPITSIKIKSDGVNIAQHSTATLYGVKNMAQTAGNSIKATGGNIVFDGTYVTHTFTSSGTFTPTQSILADYLVVAGGGGGGSRFGGGGGAGGFQTFTLQSLTATNYSVTVGAGGAGGVATGGAYTGGAGQGTNGSNSQVSSSTASVGGGGGGAGDSQNGSNGGSGGGGAGRFATSGGTATSGQGSNGGAAAGNALGTDQFRGGGGGGAGSTGGAGSSPGTGGAGLSNSFSGSSVTYAGGGGGGAGANTLGGVDGGAGGGGAGGAFNSAGTSGTANTGGGGGGGGYSSSITTNYVGGAGGSGIVIIRYKA